MHLPLILIAVVSISHVHEDDCIEWASLAKLFNQPKDSAEVASFVETHGLRESTKGPSGSFTPHDHSYSILYRENRVDTIVLRVSPFPKEHSEKHWRPYTRKLPGKLSPRDGRAAVVERLGDPVKSRRSTWIHRGVYIWVHFDEKQNSIDELFVSMRIVEASP